MNATLLANHSNPRSRSNATVSRVPSVFLSYSHQNGPAARRLLERLEATERVRVVIDKRDIHPSEPWAPRLVSLIQAADKVICLLSPEWSASEVCRWEAVHSAMTCKKHVIPVVLQRACIDGRMVLPPAPPEIETLHFIFFDKRAQVLRNACPGASERAPRFGRNERPDPSGIRILATLRRTIDQPTIVAVCSASTDPVLGARPPPRRRHRPLDR